MTNEPSETQVPLGTERISLLVVPTRGSVSVDVPCCFANFNEISALLDGGHRQPVGQWQVASALHRNTLNARPPSWGSSRCRRRSKKSNLVWFAFCATPPAREVFIGSGRSVVSHLRSSPSSSLTCFLIYRFIHRRFNYRQIYKNTRKTLGWLND